MALNVKKTAATTKAAKAPVTDAEVPGFGPGPAIPSKAPAPPAPEKKEKPKLPTPMVAAPSMASVLAAMEKESGKGFVLRGDTVPNCTRFRTGVFEFDLATGGGIPRGRITIVYGPESSGKTNLALNAVREVMALGLKVVFIDLEGTFDPAWAAEFGFDLSKLIVLKPAYGEEAVDAMEAVLRTNDVGLVIVDSIAVVVSANEIEKSTEKADMSGPILMRRMVNKAAMALAFQGRQGRFPALLLLNQTRFKIGVMYGDPEIFPGGQAVKFLSSLTVRLAGKNEIDEKYHPTIPTWKATSMIIKKAKVAINQSKTEYRMAMIPLPELMLPVGQTYSWATVTNLLKNENKLEKLSNGKYFVHGLTGEHKDTQWAKLGLLEEQYHMDDAFRAEMQGLAIGTFDGKGVLVEASDAAK